MVKPWESAEQMFGKAKGKTGRSSGIKTFLCDIACHRNALNLPLEGRGHVITDMHAAVKAFQTKLLQENLGLASGKKNVIGNESGKTAEREA